MRSALQELGVTLTPSTTPSPHATAPTQSYIDVRFAGSAADLHSITFRNYYTASVSILFAARPAKTGPEVAPACGADVVDGQRTPREVVWQTLVPHLQLMADLHSEDDAQASDLAEIGVQAEHCIDAASFPASFDPRRVSQLRICLSQPTHTLHGLRFFGRRCPLTARPAPFSEKGLLAARISVLAAEVEALAAGAVQVLPARRDLEHVSPYLVGEFDDVVHLAESQT
ncbi:hypothetical protein EMIHUDRAFT_214956 [Emiliania huxleyi CCMP1516]|uniref:Uncharacterized protein n=2 Tax=Emiliania huxleyi TaxID=2903 RepID=A0A0D3IIP4_EMIH1|nr:hypothetical protein EMIHUDRAFT_214956 [Emiliania huxleyi CCMP1516]EOD11129.1 hypothetical protein EMIHUDRAFT_214956 [Emiliania huxleyi CCMP1516]|eukprot:XP_005763558.1 hypothetical protein EMIHUDRAFT_214956 [Emiliania huxleyi CCMP1516]